VNADLFCMQMDDGDRSPGAAPQVCWHQQDQNCTSGKPANALLLLMCCLLQGAPRRVFWQQGENPTAAAAAMAAAGAHSWLCPGCGGRNVFMGVSHCLCVLLQQVAVGMQQQQLPF
jgi:rubredoxin